MSKRILNISNDESLLHTRQWVLQHAGFEVISALGFVEAQAKCLEGGFDLMIVGHTMPQKDKAALIKLMKSGCGVRVLSLRRHGQEPLPEADYSTDRTDPEGLLQAVNHVLGLRN